LQSSRIGVVVAFVFGVLVFVRVVSHLRHSLSFECPPPADG
jgi:hypothetical protein